MLNDKKIGPIYILPVYNMHIVGTHDANMHTHKINTHNTYNIAFQIKFTLHVI